MIASSFFSLRLLALFHILICKLSVLEVASGSGQHVYHFSSAYPEIVFQPTEFDVSLFSSIHAYTADLPANNHVKTPLELDATNANHWNIVSDAAAASAGYDLVITTNVFHITPWTVASGVIRGSSQVLKTGGHFVLYGAFKRDGKFSTESNAQVIIKMTWWILFSMWIM